MNEAAAKKTGTTSAAEPLYARVHKELVGRIAAGLYPVGSLMPTEAELAGEFETSRFTVREALRTLTDEGYVERRQGMGTRVLSMRPQGGYAQSFESLQELFQIALDTFLVVLGHQEVVLDAELAAHVGGAAGERWIRVDGMRWTAPGGRPLCFIQSFVPMRFAELVPEFADCQGPFFALLEERSRETIEEVQQDIQAVAMPGEISRQLGLAAGSYSLQLLRRYITTRGTLIATFNWHPANQMTYKMRIRRERHTQD